MQCLVSMVDESELPSQALTAFAWSLEKHANLRYPDGRLYVFFWRILGAFHWVLLSVDLIGSSHCWSESFGVPEEAHPFQSHHVHTITFGWRSAFGVVGGGSFCLPRDIFHLHYYTVSSFYHLSQFIQKTKCFCYVLSRELHSDIWSRRLFFFSLCVTQTYLIKAVTTVLWFSVLELDILSMSLISRVE